MEAIEETAEDTIVESEEEFIANDEIEMALEENEEEQRERISFDRSPYRNRICRRIQYREETGRQRNSWIKGVWRWKKR